ncbi:DUF3696 domain-containing protein [Desulfocurvibacter africanus]|uniref:AAA family ATPase n=1 Tax=Desulfocurvibacter africanus TaxID=873 RepID=UPI002FD99784
MITNLALQAFKSFPLINLELRPLTLLTGLNNCGKSSILQSIRMLFKSSRLTDPLLPGHGSLDELRSQMAPPDAPIVISCDFDAKPSQTLIIRHDGVDTPGSAPITEYVSAERLGPRPTLPLYRAIDEAPLIGEKGEYVLDFLHKLNDTIIPSQLHHEKSEGITLQYEIRGWLSEIAPGVEFSFKVDPKRDQAHAEYNSYRPMNVGFGLSYSLPILAALLGMVAKPPIGGWPTTWGTFWEGLRIFHGTLLMVENPEAHLHPEGQTAMGRLIALSVACGLQVIVETHSDHLIDGIRLAVKEKLIPHNNIFIHYFTKDSNGVSQVTTPQLYPNGKLSHWPKGFFDQALRNRSKLAMRD